MNIAGRLTRMYQAQSRWQRSMVRNHPIAAAMLTALISLGLVRGMQSKSEFGQIIRVFYYLGFAFVVSVIVIAAIRARLDAKNERDRIDRYIEDQRSDRASLEDENSGT